MNRDTKTFSKVQEISPTECRLILPVGNKLNPNPHKTIHHYRIHGATGMQQVYEIVKGKHKKVYEFLEDNGELLRFDASELTLRNVIRWQVQRKNLKISRIENATKQRRRKTFIVLCCYGNYEYRLGESKANREVNALVNFFNDNLPDIPRLITKNFEKSYPPKEYDFVVVEKPTPEHPIVLNENKHKFRISKQYPIPDIIAQATNFSPDRAD